MSEYVGIVVLVVLVAILKFLPAETPAEEVQKENEEKEVHE